MSRSGRIIIGVLYVAFRRRDLSICSVCAGVGTLHGGLDRSLIGVVQGYNSAVRGETASTFVLDLMTEIGNGTLGSTRSKSWTSRAHALGGG